MTTTDSSDISPAKRHRAERHLKLALEKVSEGWFPVNAVLLKKIQTGLSAGDYDLDIDFLIQDLKCDLALLTYCLKRVREETKKLGQAFGKLNHPLEMLRIMGVERLRPILLSAGQISPHELKQATLSQQQRLQESLISTTTAELICETENLDPDLGWSTALARQLGLLLISWNYPHVYRRELFSRDPSETLEHALDRALGFSPELLGFAVASSCGVEAAEQDESLSRICEIGEALARANNPTTYPSAKADWAQAQNALEDILGAEGLREVCKKLEGNAQAYLASFPEVFKSNLTPDPERKIFEALARGGSKENSYLKSCPPILRQGLEEVYRQMTNFEVSREAVQLLTRKVIVEAGFSAGCIYIFDPSSMMLVPRVRIGDSTLSYQAIRYTNTPAARDLINAAFGSQTPLIETGIALQETRIAGLLGQDQRAGVLYLECRAEEVDAGLMEPLLYFKAIRKTLIDALNLK